MRKNGVHTVVIFDAGIEADYKSFETAQKMVKSSRNFIVFAIASRIKSTINVSVTF